MEASTFCHRRTSAVLAALLAILPARELVGLRVVVGPAADLERQTSDTGPVIQTSVEAESLIARAREGVQRRDWKLAIDSFQRVVEMPGEHLLKSGDGKYESARIHAHRQIATLPAEGLQAYRTLNDAEAAILLERARAQHDPVLLRTVVQRFLLTGAGDDASVTLAEWLMDEGHFAEAAGLLRTVRLIYPDSDLPAWLIPSRLSICLAAMGQHRRSEELLSQLEALPRESSLPSAKLEQMRQFIARRPVDRPTKPLSDWPMVGGNLARDGVQHAVEPSLLEEHCMTAVLPIRQLTEVSATIDDLAVKAGFIPGRQIVTQGDLVVVKAARNLVALDANTLSPVWVTEPPIDPADPPVEPRGGRVQFVSPSRSGRLQDLRQPQALLALACPANTDVVIAGDRVLTLTYPEGGLPIPTLLQGPQDPNLVFFAQQGLAGTSSNRVTAYALKDGSFLWHSDTAGLAGTATAPADEVVSQFLAAPVAVDGDLLAPCRINNDLYLVALDPATGKHAWHVYLCGMGPISSRGAVEAMRITVADAVAFVLTGQGLLVAVELPSRSVLWAVRYQSRKPAAREPARTLDPPVATADVLLAVPPDAEQLICIDRFTGDVRWRIELSEPVQILGADQAHAWLAGNELQMIDLQTGKPVWAKASIRPSGRGVISGNRIYLPTAGGLIAAQTADGEPIKLNGTGSPMVGNLLAWDGALYAVGISQVRKYPDLVSGYDLAVERHQADPTNPLKAIRLARLELLRGRPAETIAALKAVPGDLETQDARRYGQVAHLRVRALLAMAADAQTSADQAMEHLRQAGSIAESPDDRIETALALGDHFKRHGRPLDACSQYLKLALSTAGDETVGLEQGFRQRARLLANSRIAETTPSLSADEQQTLHKHAETQLLEAVARQDRAFVRRALDCPVSVEIAQEAALRLAVWAIEDLQFEQAESLLRQALARAQSPGRLAEAAARLASICLLPAELHRPMSAAELLDRMERGWPTTEIPAEVLSDLLDPPAQHPPAAAKTTAGDAARRLRQRIDLAVLARHRAEAAPCLLGTPRRTSVTSAQNGQPLIIRNEFSEASRDTLITLFENKRIEARQYDGQVARSDSSQAAGWQVELKLSDQPAVEMGDAAFLSTQTIFLSGGLAEPYTSWTGPAASGLLDGQTIIVNSEFGLHAVGLLTGRRLWSRPFEPPCPPGSKPVVSDLWVWTQDGYLVSIDANNRLEAARACDGNSILWSRLMPQRQWRTVRARGQYVVAADKDLQKVDVFRLADGRHVATCQFSQPKGAIDKINLLLFDDIICGPVSDKEIAAFELSAPGTERWRTATTAPLSQIFKPAPELTAVADQLGNIDILDPATGKSRRRILVPICENGVIDGILSDGVYYLVGYRGRPLPGIAAFGSWQYCLAAVRAEDGTILWDRAGVDLNTFMTNDVLRMSSNAIPLVSLVQNPVDSSVDVQAAATTRPATSKSYASVQLLLVDKATGKDLGKRLLAPFPQGIRSSSVLDVAAWPDEIVVRTTPSTFRFALETPASMPAVRDNPR